MKALAIIIVCLTDGNAVVEVASVNKPLGKTGRVTDARMT